MTKQKQAKVEQFLDRFGTLLQVLSGPGIGGHCERVPFYKGPMSDTLRRIGDVIGPANLARTLVGFDEAYEEMFGCEPEYREELRENLEYSKKRSRVR